MAVMEFDFWYPSPEYMAIVLCTTGLNDINRALQGFGVYIDYSGDDVRFIENGIEYLKIKKDYKKQVLDACDCLNIAVGANFRRSKENLRRLVTNYIYGIAVVNTNTAI